jgi:hypothetical protein
MGCAVMKLPPATRMSALAIGEFANPIDSNASISKRTRPTASFTHCMVAASVRRIFW